MTSEANSARPKIVVVGSINMDLVVACRQLPRPGETIHGHSIQELPGGKGANQAVAAARLGAEVTLISRVGDDTFAPQLLENLAQEQVDIGHVRQTSECSSGIAIVAVEESGENAITIIGGANQFVSAADVRDDASVIAEADMVLLQLETPVETAIEAIAVAREHGKQVMLDPAPAPKNFPPALLEVDFICPNETETAALTGLPVETNEQALVAATALCDLGARCAIITRGSRGALVYPAGGKASFVKSVVVDVVDTTAAGDAFAAAFAVELSGGASAVEAAQFACRAGAAAASRLGAQIAMPTRDEL